MESIATLVNYDDDGKHLRTETIVAAAYNRLLNRDQMIADKHFEQCDKCREERDQFVVDHEKAALHVE